MNLAEALELRGDPLDALTTALDAAQSAHAVEVDPSNVGALEEAASIYADMLAALRAALEAADLG